MKLPTPLPLILKIRRRRTPGTQVLDSPSMKSFNTDLVIAFCDTIREAGYYPILYTGLYWLNNRLDVSRLEGKYDIWIAQYSTSITKPGYDKATIWQYASNGRYPAYRQCRSQQGICRLRHPHPQSRDSIICHKPNSRDAAACGIRLQLVKEVTHGVTSLTS